MSRLGVTIGDVVNAFKGLGMDSLAVNIRQENVPEMPLPAVISWEQRHFVVLYKVKADKYYIVDPSRGKLKFESADFFKFWFCENDKGVAILADPTEEFEARKFEKPRTNWRLIRMLGKMLMRHRCSFAAVILLSILGLLADIAMPLLFQHTIDEGIMGGNISLVWMLICSQLLVFLGNYIGSSVTQVLLTKLGLKTGIDMMNRYLRKLVRLPMIFFEQKVNSDLIQKAEEQTRIRSFLTSIPETFFLSSLSLIVFSGMLIYFSPLIFLLFLTVTAVSLGWTALFLRRRRELDYSAISAIAENRNNLYELIYGMPEVKANNAQHIKINNWMRVQQRINSLSVKTTLLGLYQSGGNTFLNRLKDIAVTGICALLVIDGHMSIGEMMTVSYIIGRLSGPMDTLIGAVEQGQSASMSYSRVEEILNSEEAPDRGKVPDKNADAVRFQNVSFKYPGTGSPFVLKDLNFAIPKGKITAIVGASGCGKSTLIKLLLGMFPPHTGSIIVGNDSLTQISHDKWLEKCGAVLQGGTIFSGTLLSNIALCDETPDIERARNAAKTSCLHQFIDELPMGYMTRVGVAGVEMSGGQKQRLMIARAVYKDPDILILDEATSSLDAGNEAMIVNNLSNFFHGRTVVIAAHRLSTVSRADNILFIDTGRIVEQGTHDDLIAGRGSYYQLVKNQLELGS